jgi:hypothetical protein
MRNILLYIFFVIPAIFFAPDSAHAQARFIEYDNEENLLIQYRWSRSSPFNKESDAVLNLRVVNYNDTHIKWNYSIGLYNQGVKFFESEISELCLNPGESRRGSLAGLRFSAEGITMEDVEDPGFAWEFVVFDVQKVGKCD